MKLLSGREDFDQKCSSWIEKTHKDKESSEYIWDFVLLQACQSALAIERLQKIKSDIFHIFHIR